MRDDVALNEVVLDLKVETNRGDCLSVYGVAREVATLFRADLAPPPGREPAATGPGASRTRSASGSRPRPLLPLHRPRLHRRAHGASPLWLRQRLAAAGVRPISNVVDITNYVTLGIGQPLHAYDGARIPGNVLTARRARPGERVSPSTAASARSTRTSS